MTSIVWAQKDPVHSTRGDLVLTLTLVATLLASGLLGCAPRRADLDYRHWIRLGVDPEAETAAVIENMERYGYVEEARIDGHDWTAVAMRHGDRVAIRGVTHRGVVLGLDPSGFENYRLVPPLLATRHDLDSDGRDELIVAHTLRAPNREAECYVVYRVAAASIDEIAVDYGRVANACIERLEHNSGSIRLFAAVHLRDFDLEPPPTLMIPVNIGPAGEYALQTPNQAATALRHGRQTVPSNFDARIRNALELAWLDAWSGESAEHQLATFDRAMQSADGPSSTRSGTARDDDASDESPARAGSDSDSAGTLDSEAASGPSVPSASQTARIESIRARIGLGQLVFRTLAEPGEAAGTDADAPSESSVSSPAH